MLYITDVQHIYHIHNSYCYYQLVHLVDDCYAIGWESACSKRKYWTKRAFDSYNNVSPWIIKVSTTLDG